MLNVSKISSESFLGRVLRSALRVVPKNAIVRVLQGPLRGAKWIVGSGVSGYWLGTYEIPMQRAFTRVVKAGDVVFDIGAHVGFFTLLASRLVGPEGQVFAFEPSSRNRQFLEQHLALNKITNVRIVPAAASLHSGVGGFLEGQSSFTGRLVEKGSGESVPTIGIDEEISRGKFPMPNVIKMDVEGSEKDVLGGMKNLLYTKHPTIIASILPNDRALLSEAGYKIWPLEGDSVATTEVIAVFSRATDGNPL